MTSFVLARAALDAGDLGELAALLTEHPDVVHHRHFAGDWYDSGYFAGATLLHRVLEMLIETGVRVDLDKSGVLDYPLWNDARATAEALVHRGAPMGLRHAAALGRAARRHSGPRMGARSTWPRCGNYWGEVNGA